MKIEFAKHLLSKRFCYDWAELERRFVQRSGLALELH